MSLTVVLTVAPEDECFMDAILRKYAKYNFVIDERVGLAKARRESIDKVTTPYTLILDCDTILPNGYIEEALELLELHLDIAVVALDYEYPWTQGHYAFGTSIWRTETLKKLYDWTKESRDCECIYMMRKAQEIKGKIVSLPYQAKHLKAIGDKMQ